MSAAAGHAAAGFAHPILRAATPAAWVAAASTALDVLLIDHANCEKKAASTALSLMFAYAEDLALTDKMSRLAREELRHYEQVAGLMQSLGIVPRRLAPGRYAQALRRLASKAEPHREVDLMLCGALIEARSCERFAALAPAIGGPAGELFRGRGPALSGVSRPGAARRGTRGNHPAAALAGVRAA
jgi:tRNA-(ms[2]io[6]A)-hydroxylase